jgi:Flp pilus assembly protein TadG
MKSANNERGTILVFVTLMIVLLLIMVGMGLDTGHLVYIRSQAQPAVDAAALAAASAVPTGNPAEVNNRVAAFNTSNSYLNSTKNQIGSANITYVNYDSVSNSFTALGSIAGANGVRVALEATNPYGGSPNTAMKSPLFLTPLFNLFGIPTEKTTDVNVSAVAVVRAGPDLPIAMEDNICGTKVGETYPTVESVKLLQSNAKDETSGYTTYYIHNASKTEIYNLLQGGLSCASSPPVGVGFCTELNNGQISSIYSDFEAVFLAGKTESPPRCYFIPVVATGTTFNQCSNILQFARFCPKPGDDGFGLGKTKSADGKGYDKYLYGDITCGANPYNSPWAKCQIPVLVRDKPSGM